MKIFVLAASTIPTPAALPAPTLDLAEVFYACPIIYSLLFLLSITSTVIWLYSMFTLKLSSLLPSDFLAPCPSAVIRRKY